MLPLLWAAKPKYLLWLRHWFQCSPVRPVKSRRRECQSVNAVSLGQVLADGDQRGVLDIGVVPA
jgi:hypothetical protein